MLKVFGKKPDAGLGYKMQDIRWWRLDAELKF
jgi:hypothetical protein